MGCTKPEDKAAALGFDSVEQMEEVKKLGFNTMDEYLGSLLPKSGCSNVDELKHAMQETGSDCNYLKKIRKEQEAEYAEQQRQEKIKRDLEQAPFPFFAIITCGNSFPVFACFNDTELEIRNGSEYKMYKVAEIMSIPQGHSERRLTFELRKNFEIVMQNSDDSLILNLKIYNSITDELVFEKSASKYRVIKVSN